MKTPSISSPAAAPDAGPDPGPGRSPGFGLRRASASVIPGLVLFYAAHFPPAGTALASALLVYTITVLLVPRAWLLILPCVACSYALAFSSGYRALDEFDLFVLVTLASGLWHMQPGSVAHSRLRGTWPLLLFGLSQLLAALIGLASATAAASVAPLEYLAPANALRELKPVAWSVLLLPLLIQAFDRDPIAAKRWLTAGLALALAVITATLVWERGLYPGLFDFDHPYRVTGPFFDLHVGGAALDVTLVVLGPLVAGLCLPRPGVARRLVAAALLAGALYGLLVTYSRVNYLALATMGAVVVAGLGSRRGRAVWRRWGIAAAFVLSAALLVTLLLPVIGGTIGQRFEQSATDGAVRLHHWRHGLALPGGAAEYLFGIGKGAYPRRFSAHQQASGRPLPTIKLVVAEAHNALRFGPSDARGSLDLRQRIELPSGSAPLRLQLVARTTVQRLERLLIELCARHLRRVERECRWVGFNIQAGHRDWVTYEAHVRPPRSRPHFAWWRSPTDISLLNRGILDGLEIAAVRLLDAGGRDLLANGDFAAGGARWYFVDGNHLRWRLQNLFVYLLVESGILGLAAFLVLTASSLRQAWRIRADGDAAGVAFAAAIAGVLVIGLVDSVLDQPRSAWLVMLVLALPFAWRAERVLPYTAPHSGPHTGPHTGPNTQPRTRQAREAAIRRRTQIMV